jgi:PAS domain S-box-containing protein
MKHLHNLRRHPRRWDIQSQRAFIAPHGNDGAMDRAAHERLASRVIDTIGDMVFWMDASGRFVYVNDAACLMLAYSRAELLAMTACDIDENQTQAEWIETWQALRANRFIVYETVFRTKNGASFPAELRTSLIDFEGREYGCTLARDFTIPQNNRQSHTDLIAKDEAAMNIAQMGHWEFDISRGLFLFNDTYYKLHGVTAAEMGGYEMSLAEFSHRLIHPDDSHQLQLGLQTALDVADPAFERVVVRRILRSDGSWRWVRVWFRILSDEANRTVKLIGVNQDIHEQIMAEIALRESEARNHALLNAIPDIMFLVRRDGTFIDVHTRNPDALYLPAEEFISRNIAALFSPELTQRVLQACALALDTGIEQVLDYQLPMKGEQRYFEARVIRCYEDVVMILVRDIQERKAIELALKQAHAEAQRNLAMFQGLLSAIPLPVYFKDIHGRFLGCNEAYCRIFNLKADLIVGKTPAEVWPNSVGSLYAQKDAELLSSPGLQVYEYISPDVNGQPRAVINFKTVFLNENAEIAGIVGVIVDITDRKRAEAEVIRLNTELEGRVQRRTAQLEEANRELEAFAYSISHDMRAPLRAVDGFSQILSDDYASLLDEPGREYLRRVRAAAQRMGIIIDGLMDLSNLSRVELHFSLVDLSELVTKIAVDLSAADPSRRVEWEIEAGCAARSDPSLMYTVLKNLLSNAWKFTSREPAARIEFGLQTIADEKIFFVRDNGVGFDMAYAEKLFSVFQRQHDVRKYPGVGIGLAIVHRILTRHGGRIWAETQPGQGAVFYFTLPNPAS